MDVNQKYTSLLNEQIAKIGKECRYLEFKSNYQEVDKLGRYISALSNGACLDHKDFAYLYFGVDDETLEIKGTTFDCARMKAVGNEALELYLRRMVVPKVNFSIIEFMYEGKLRVVLFKIPAAVNEPTTYKQKPYIRVDSHVTDLTPYVDWMRQIYTSQIDWSAQIVEMQHSTILILRQYNWLGQVINCAIPILQKPWRLGMMPHSWIKPILHRMD